MTEGYDAIVVGAGSAGCIVAARLSADSARSVLLLEAGPDLGTSASPALRDGWGLPRGSDWPFDWGYQSEPDAAGQTDPLRRGRLVGGTSWLTRFAVRGSPADYDAWAAAGNHGWSFEDVLPAFRDLETDAEFGDAPWHGAGGPIPITRYPEVPRAPIHATIVETLVAAGFPPIDDHNRPGAVGVGPMPMSGMGGRRVTSADAYVPVGARPANLKVQSGATVAAIVLQGGRTTGVRLLDGSVITADGVVLCAGTYGSPALLQRSGIGPAAVLDPIGIASVIDLPGVGQNLADHPAVELELDWSGTPRPSPILHSLATWRSRDAAADSPSDLLFWFGDPQGSPAAVSIECVLMRPRSRGSVRIASADPTAPPRISLAEARDGTDVDRLGEAYLRAVEIAAFPKLRAACDSSPTAPANRTELRRFVLENTYHLPHVVGTCAMGTSPADGAVVDPQGRVHGVEGLRVVDASIIPEPPSGFPNLVTMMLAERLSASMSTAI